MAKTYRPRTKKVRAQIVCWEQLNTIRSFLDDCKANMVIVFSKSASGQTSLSVTINTEETPSPIVAHSGDYLVFTDGFLSVFTEEEFHEHYEACQ